MAATVARKKRTIRDTSHLSLLRKGIICGSMNNTETSLYHLRYEDVILMFCHVRRVYYLKRLYKYNAIHNCRTENEDLYLKKIPYFNFLVAKQIKDKLKQNSW